MSDEVRENTAVGWYGICETSGGPMVRLYSDHPSLKWPIANVYLGESLDEEFPYLPPDLQKAIQSEIAAKNVDNISESALSKEKAQTTKFWHNMEPRVFAVRKRRIDWVETQNAWGGTPAGTTASGEPAGDYVWEPMSEEQEQLMHKLVDELALIHSTMVKAAYKTVINKDVSYDEVKDDALAIYRGISYDFNRHWPTVRGSQLKSANVFDLLEEPLQAIIDGEPETFLNDMAVLNPLLVDADHAKATLQIVGETGISTSGDERAEQAKKVWLFIDLVSKYGIDRTTAISMVNDGLEQIPF
jgi:hypothetical protein